MIRLPSAAYSDKIVKKEMNADVKNLVRQVSKLDDLRAKEAIRARLKKEREKLLKKKLKGARLTLDVKRKHSDELEVTDQEVESQLTTLRGLEKNL